MQRLKASLRYRRDSTRHDIPESLEALAMLISAEAQPGEIAAASARRACRLWGAAASARAAFGTPLRPNERDAYERELATVRAELGDAIFAAVWTTGQAMTLEQAIAYALEEAG